MALPSYLSLPSGSARRFCLSVAVLALSACGVAGAPAQAQKSSARVLLPMAQRTLAGGTDAGDAPASQPVSGITVELKRTDAQQADLEDFLKGTQKRGSSTFHHWLTPAGFAARFAPSNETVAQVRSWLESQGLTVQSVSAGGMRLTVSGTIAQTDAAFQVRLHRLAQATGDALSVTGTPSVPAALASSVRQVNGLDEAATIAQDPIVALAASVDANTSAVLIADLKSAPDASTALLPVLEQASAQGQSVLILHANAAALPERALAITVVDAAAAPQADASESTLRPSWQVAAGLPNDSLRVAPDAAVASSAAALQSALQTIVAKAGTRQGEVAETFYELAPVEGVFTHADNTVPAGTWTSADGLGTVNTAALIKAWPYGVTVPDSTAIALSAHTITHGSQFTLTATVTGSSGTPTGSVTFASAQGGTLGTSPLSGGVATYTTNLLPGGQYGFYGTYSGDSTYAGNTTNVDTVTVNPEAAMVTGSVPATATGVGATIPVTVTVVSASGVGTPSGTVTVYPNGTDIAQSTYTGTLVASATAGTATAAVSVPASNAGSFTFQTNCTTDASFSCYSPTSFAVTIAKGTPAIRLTETGTATAATLKVTVTAPAGSGTGVAVPTGTVQFLDGSATLATQTLDSTGTATYTGALSGGSTHSVTAQFLGDGNYNTATAVANASTTTTPTVTLSLSGTTLTATVTPASSAGVSPVSATGTVQFFNGTTLLGSGTLNASGVATYTGTLPASYAITAVYGGDSRYDTATSNSIGSGTTVPTAVLTSASTSTAAAASLSVTVTPPSGTATTPTGTVQFLDGTTVLATQALSSTGTASYAGPLTSATTHALTAVYGGDTVFAAATSNTVTITNTLIATTTSLTSPSGASVAAGTSFSLVSVVTPASLVAAGTSPSGTITVMDGTLAVGTGTLANGTAAVTVSGLAPGTHMLTAVYTGDASYAASSSTPPLKITTTKGATTTTLAPITSPKAGVPVTVSATVANAGGGTGAYTYSGTVSFYSNNRLIGKAAVSGSGAATGTVTFTSSASQSVTAVYSGDTNWLASTSAAVTVIPTSIPAAIVLSSNYTTGLVGQNITLTAAVTTGDPASTLVPSGTITFYDTYKGVLVNLGSATLASNAVNTGFAQISTTGLQAGTHSISAVYAGDAVFQKTTSAGAVAINMQDYAVTFAPSSLNVTAGSNVTTTLTVSAVNGFTGHVALSCTAPGDTLTTCSVSPATVTVGGTAKVTVTTSATSASSVKPLRGSSILSAMGLGGVLSLCLLRRRRRVASLLLILLAAAMMAGGCGTGDNSSNNGGSGSLNTGTPLGTLGFTVTAASTDAPVNTRHNFQLSVTVQ